MGKLHCRWLARWCAERGVSLPLAGGDALGIQTAPVAELHTAKGTVVERCAQQAKQETQGVWMHSIQPVTRHEPGQVAIMAAGALAVTLENGEQRAIIIPDEAAAVAFKGGPAGYFGEKASPSSRCSATAINATLHFDEFLMLAEARCCFN